MTTISVVDLIVNSCVVAANNEFVFQGLEWVALSTCFYWGKKIKIDCVICSD